MEASSAPWIALGLQVIVVVAGGIWHAANVKADARAHADAGDEKVRDHVERETGKLWVETKEIRAMAHETGKDVARMATDISHMRKQIDRMAEAMSRLLERPASD